MKFIDNFSYVKCLCKTTESESYGFYEREIF